MNQRIKRHFSILSACAGLLAGCGAADATSDHAEAPDLLAQQVEHDAGVESPHDGGSHPAPDGSTAAGSDGGVEPAQACTETFPLYRPGLSVRSGALTVQIVSALPVPPRMRVPNDWVITIADASGAAVPGLLLEGADTYMPLHRHNGNAPANVEALPDGRFKLDNLSFTMRGAWQVYLDVSLPGAGSTQIIFPICVE